MTERYHLRVARPAARHLSEVLPQKVASAAVAFIHGPLLDGPRRVGKPLGPPFVSTWTARRGSYRVLYEIHDEARTVLVVAVRHRSDAYRG